MKKAIKIIGIIALIVASIVCTILYCVFPNETQEYIRNFWSFINTPLPIIGLSLVVIGGFTLKALSMTSWGKRALNELREAWSKWKKEVSEVQNHEEELVKKSETLETKVNLILENYGDSQKCLVMLVYEICMTSPNKKINAIGERVKELYPLALEEAQEVAYKEVEEKSTKDKGNETSAENMGLDENLGETKGLGVQNG